MCHISESYHFVAFANLIGEFLFKTYQAERGQEGAPSSTFAGPNLCPLNLVVEGAPNLPTCTHIQPHASIQSRNKYDTTFAEYDLKIVGYLVSLSWPSPVTLPKREAKLTEQVLTSF